MLQACEGRLYMAWSHEHDANGGNPDQRSARERKGVGIQTERDARRQAAGWMGWIKIRPFQANVTDKEAHG